MSVRLLIDEGLLLVFLGVELRVGRFFVSRRLM